MVDFHVNLVFDSELNVGKGGTIDGHEMLETIRAGRKAGGKNGRG